MRWLWCGVLCVCSVFAQLGPGSGPWRVGRPEDHGLSSERLAQAATNTRGIEDRACFLVIKDGVLVHETYFRGDANTRHVAFSGGKSFAAALAGVAVTRGLLDLDRPLADYGVTPRANFGNFWPRVTTRHFLGQTSGQGVHPPGEEFIYDSAAYINHVSYVLNWVVGQPTGRWGTENFARPLGVPDIWALEQNDISVGGGQSLTCREYARLGQLILNRGLWLDGDGRPYELVSSDYIRQMTSPAFPNANFAYGFLTWLNQPAVAPQFWARGACTERRETGFPVGNGVDVGAPRDLVSAMGFAGQYATVIPSRSTVIVTMGFTLMGSPSCFYDSHAILTAFWVAVGGALIAASNATV